MRYVVKVFKLISVGVLICSAVIIGYFFLSSPNFELSYFLENSAKGIKLNATIILVVIFSIFYIVYTVKKERDHMIESIVSDENNRSEDFPLVEYKEIEYEYKMLKSNISNMQAELAGKKLALERIDKEMHELFIERISKNMQYKKLYNLTSQRESAVQDIINNIKGYVWMVDYNSKLVDCNDALKNQIPGLKIGHSTVSDIIEFAGSDQIMFNKRDYNNVFATIKSKFGLPIRMYTYRLFDGYSLARIFFVGRLYNIENNTDIFIRMNKNLNFVAEISDIISRNVIDKQYIDFILDKICGYAKLRAASIRLIDRKKKKKLKIYALSSRHSIPIIPETELISKTHAGLAFKTNKMVKVNFESDMKMEERMVSEILKNDNHMAFIPLATNDVNIGVLTIVGSRPITKDLTLLLDSITINLTIALEKIFLYDELRKNYLKTLEVYLGAYEARVSHMPGHSKRVARISKLIAKRLYFDQREIDDLYVAGLLHDVGKLQWHESPNKADGFKNHGKTGREIMENVGLSEDILKGIEMHHQDYITPDGILPLYPQLVRVANDLDIYVYDEPTEENFRKFVSEAAKKTNREYSPQLIDVLSEIVENKPSSLLKIYRGGRNVQ